MRGGCSTRSRRWRSPRRRRSAARSPTPGCSRCWASACAATTRAASSSTTPSARCTSPCAAPTPTPSLYWFMRMLDGGADPRYMARRLIRMAAEDIGLADPRALRLALDAAEVYERLGTPEGELALAECVIYLAMAPKSNAVYNAFNEAKALIKQGRHAPGAAAPAQRADQADEGPRLRQGLPLRARRGGRLCRRRELFSRGHASRRSSTGRWSGAWRSASREKLRELRSSTTRKSNWQMTSTGRGFQGKPRSGAVLAVWAAWLQSRTTTRQ